MVLWGRAEKPIRTRRRIRELCSHHRKPTLAASAAGRLNSDLDEPEPPFSNCLISLKSFDDVTLSNEEMVCFKGWGIKLAKRIGMKKAKVAIVRKIAVILPGRTGS
jgi:hypothetical protein